MINIHDRAKLLVITLIGPFWKTLVHRRWCQHPYLCDHDFSHNGCKDLLFYWLAYNNDGIWTALALSEPYDGRVKPKMSYKISHMSCKWIDLAFPLQPTQHLWCFLYSHVFSHNERIYSPRSKNKYYIKIYAIATTQPYLHKAEIM